MPFISLNENISPAQLSASLTVAEHALASPTRKTSFCCCTAFACHHCCFYLLYPDMCRRYRWFLSMPLCRGVFAEQSTLNSVDALAILPGFEVGSPLICSNMSLRDVYCWFSGVLSLLGSLGMLLSIRLFRRCRLPPLLARVPAVCGAVTVQTALQPFHGLQRRHVPRREPLLGAHLACRKGLRSQQPCARKCTALP